MSAAGSPSSSRPSLTGISAGASPFGRGAVLAILFAGFAGFLAMVYAIAQGDTGPARNDVAHASANGLNGYSALARLVAAQGRPVLRSRSPEALRGEGLVVLTPERNADPETIGAILADRAYIGPTLLILPKWSAAPPGDEVIEADRERMQDDWVQLGLPRVPRWLGELPEPFALQARIAPIADPATAAWRGYGLSGALPTGVRMVADFQEGHETRIDDPEGRVLALRVIGAPRSDYREHAFHALVVVEPDLVNNMGLADPVRAAAALALVEDAGYGVAGPVTFDLTLAGLGGSTNLLTLAFTPPFLAATLCLILAVLAVAWRALLRFGPPRAAAAPIAAGKSQLVANGAALIVRARRSRLLAAPYAALVARRLAQRLGLPAPRSEAIDAALAARLPDEEPFTARAARLREAASPSDILREARALDDLTRKLD